jgi:hypothetical protein
MSRRTQVVVLAAALGACGRIGFANLTDGGVPGGGDASLGDATSSDAAFAAVLLGSDDFGRTVANGWGNADLGGPCGPSSRWEMPAPSASYGSSRSWLA